ncbi:glycerophosphodiester phosphodiesterase [Streptomyces sp. NPDC054796]
MLIKAVLVPLLSLVLAAPLHSAVAAPAAEPAAAPRDDDPARTLAPHGRVTYTAHRGGSLEVPENSMSGLTEALRRGTASALDVDVRRLRDGTLVAMHDATLNRTTTAKGPVRKLDRHQWGRIWLRHSPRLRGSWPREHPPTLAKVLDRFGGHTPLVLELKDPAGLGRLGSMLRGRKLTGSVHVQSNSVALAARARSEGLLTSVWRSARQLRTDRPERWRRTVDILSVDHRARARDVRRAVDSGVARVWGHTVNTPAARDRMVRLGCDTIVTDAPGLLSRTPRRTAAPPG